MQLHRGIIIELKPDEAKARAILPAMDGMETDWLPVAQHWTHRGATYQMPRMDQQVYVIYAADHAADGLILASLYSQKHPVPTPKEGLEADSYFISTADGTKLHIKPGYVYISTPGDIEAEAKGTITASAAGAIHAETKSSLTAKAASSATVEAGSQATIKAPQITLDAPQVTITGALKVANDAVISGKSFLGHRHGGVMSGTSTTAVPV